MSARFAQYLPIVEPARVAGQILIAGCPVAEIPLPPDMLADWYSREGDVDRMVELVTSFTSQPVDEAVLRKFGEAAAKIPRVALEQTMTMCTDMSFADKLADVRTPSLVIGGVDDQMFTADLLREAVVAPLAGARLVLVEAGHEIPIERPRETAALIEAFVAGLGTRSATR
jgi:non-heme chloroperoxidase